MRKLLTVAAAVGLAGAGLLAVAGTAQADDCTLVQSEIYTGANTVQWAQGLEGCEGDVQWEIQSQDADGSWSVDDSGTHHYNDQTANYSGDVELPCVLRIKASFDGQEIVTRAAHNNNCGG